MSAIDRTAWPWHSAAAACTDYDEATWHAVRKSSAGALPVQSLDQWVRRQRASRDVWEWSEPESLSEAEHEQLRVDLIEAWSDPRLDPAVIEARKPRWVNGALVGGGE